MVCTSTVIERFREWPRPKTHKEKVEQAIDRLMLVEAWLFWYIQELEDLKAQLSMDLVLRRLVPIVEVMINQLWQLMRRWIAKKNEIIKVVREGLTKKKKKIEGNGFTIYPTYHKGVIDLIIYLHGGEGRHVPIPDLGIPSEILKAIRMGWRASDSSDNEDRYPVMGTHFIWQVLSWLIAYPSTDVNIYAQGISISMSGIKPRWSLQINGFNVEWSSDEEAYQEMVKYTQYRITTMKRYQ